MKVLHLVKTSIGATWALIQMRELVKLGVEVHVALPSNGILVEKYKEYGIKVHFIKYNLKPISFVCCLIKLRKLIEEIQPDIIHSHFVITTLIMRVALIGLRIPRIFQVPGPLHLEHYLYRQLDLKTSNRNDFWIGSCNWTVNKYYNSGITRNRVFLSYYGNDFNGVHHKKGLLRQELGIKDNLIIVGMVAYMYAPKRWLGQKRGIKGHEDYIDAINLLLEDGLNIVPICIGGAWNEKRWYEDRVKQYAKMKCGDRLIFLGTRRDVSDLYLDIDIVVHPSYTENLGGAAESLMLGIPTITTNVGGFPDIIKNNKTGILVEPNNPKQIASAISLLINNFKIRDLLSKNGKKSVKDMLDIRNTSKSVYDIYIKILNEHRK